MNFENMPHCNILTGLLRNVAQAVGIVSKHPLDSLINVPEDEEEEYEENKKKKILQTIVGNDEERKAKHTQSEATIVLQTISTTPSYRLKNVMFKKMLLKLVLLCYEEKFKDKSTCDVFCDFVYSVLAKKYMMKKAAESKYHHLLASCVKYKSISRVRVFARFLGLYDAFDNDDLIFYMECFEFLQNSPSGVFLPVQDFIEVIYVPYIRCIECIKYYEKILPKKGVAVLRLKLDKMRRLDKANRLGVVDIDEFLEQMVETYNEFNKSTKDFLKSAYEAADLNDDGYLQYKEFELLLRFVSQIDFNLKTSFDLFEEYCENFLSEDDEEIKAISFENLCQMNRIHSIFTVGSIRNLTEVSTVEEAIAKLEPIKSCLDEILSEFMWRFSESSLWEDHIEELQSLLDSIKDKIENKEFPEMALLAYKLMDLDSKRTVVQDRLNELLPIFSIHNF